MKPLKWLWDYFDGKKTKIGAVATVLTGLAWIAKGYFPNLVPEEAITGLTLLSGTVLTTGVAHKGVKGKDEIQKSINKVVNLMKK